MCHRILQALQWNTSLMQHTEDFRHSYENITHVWKSTISFTSRVRTVRRKFDHETIVLTSLLTYNSNNSGFPLPRAFYREIMLARASSKPPVPLWERFQCMGLHLQHSPVSKQVNYK